MLALLHKEMAEHPADCITGTPLRLRAPVQVCCGQTVQILQRGVSDRCIIGHEVSEVEPWEVGNLLCGVAKAAAFFGKAQSLVPAVALPEPRSVLGKGLNPAILDTCRMLHQEVNMIRVRMGLETTLCRGETVPGPGGGRQSIRPVPAL
jgi:hypothetical protein